MRSSSVMKYLGATMAVGGSIMLGTSMIGAGSSVKKKVKKTANKALNVLDSALTNVQNMVK